MGSDALTLAWLDAEAALPAGWSLDGLRCASTGLSPEQRSDDWVARAVGPAAEVRESRADDPIAALDALVRSFGTGRGATPDRATR